VDGPTAAEDWAVPWRPVLGGLAALAWFAGTSTVPRATQAGVLVVVAVALAVVLLAREGRARAVAAVTALLTLFLSIPVSRIPDGRELLLLVAAGAAVLGGVAVLGASRRGLPRGTGLLVLLVAVLAAATAVGGHEGGLLTLALVAVAGVPVFLVTGSLDARGRRDVALVVVGLAVGQALLALAEPFVVPQHLWAPAQLGSSGQPVALTNELVGSIERSQGTLGHPLPLGLLLVVALALTTRHLTAHPRALRLAVQGVLLGGIVVAGARSSLVMAVVVLVLLSGRLTPARLVTAMSAAVAGLVALMVSSADLALRLGEIEASGSWQHRLGAVRSVERLLLRQDPRDVLLGNGYGSTSEVIGEGLLQNDGFAAVDNQFVLLLSQGGLVALVLLLALLATAAFRGEATALPALLCVGATLVVFDVLLWPGATVVLGTVLGLALTAGATDRQAAP